MTGPSSAPPNPYGTGPEADGDAQTDSVGTGTLFGGGGTAWSVGDGVGPVKVHALDCTSMPSLHRKVPPGSVGVGDTQGRHGEDVTPGSAEMHRQGERVAPGPAEVHTHGTGVAPGPAEVHTHGTGVAPGPDEVHTHGTGVAPGTDEVHVGVGDSLVGGLGDGLDVLGDGLGSTGGAVGDPPDSGGDGLDDPFGSTDDAVGDPPDSADDGLDDPFGSAVFVATPAPVDSAAGAGCNGGTGTPQPVAPRWSRKTRLSQATPRRVAIFRPARV